MENFRFIKNKITKTLEEASFGLQVLKDDFFIIGSAALILSDIQLCTNDIDILVSDRDAEYLKSLWSKRNKLIDGSPTEKFRSNFSRYSFQDIDIEIIGDLEVNVQNKWEKLIIHNFNYFEISKLKIKIPTLEEMKRVLSMFGREKDLKKILAINDKLQTKNIR